MSRSTKMNPAICTKYVHALDAQTNNSITDAYKSMNNIAKNGNTKLDLYLKELELINSKLNLYNEKINTINIYKHFVEKEIHKMTNK